MQKLSPLRLMNANKNYLSECLLWLTKRQLNMNEEYLQRQTDLIRGNNVNVGKTNDIVQFFYLVCAIVLIILSVYFLSDFFIHVFIKTMPNKTQVKLENIMSAPVNKADSPVLKKYSKDVEFLNKIKEEIVRSDISLRNRNNIKISVILNKDINAFVLPNGSIYFTSALLDEKLSKEELAFLLAHEIGHYAKRDHLLALGRSIMVQSILTLLFFDGNATINLFVKGAFNLSSLNYSRKSEFEADRYAANTLVLLYGTKAGAVRFMQRLKDMKNEPPYFYYFSTHPIWQERLQLLNAY